MTQTSHDPGVFGRYAFTAEFESIVAQHLGDRSHLAIPDDVIFPRVMAVIWTGVSHAEAADESCPAEAILERHKEWCEALVLPEFLLRYPSLVIKLRQASR